jgi:hypothetical protein
MEYFYVLGWVLGVVGGTFCFAALQWPQLLTSRPAVLPKDRSENESTATFGKYFMDPHTGLSLQAYEVSQDLELAPGVCRAAQRAVRMNVAFELSRIHIRSFFRRLSSGI